MLRVDPTMGSRLGELEQDPLRRRDLAQKHRRTRRLDRTLRFLNEKREKMRRLQADPTVLHIGYRPPPWPPHR